MPQIHIKLNPNIHNRLKKKANTYNYSIQEFVEKCIELSVRESSMPYSLFPANVKKKENHHLFTFIDVFAGIGGFHLAFKENGGHCVFTSEWDRWCQKTYLENFGIMPEGDITKIDVSELPDHDVLVAGFPCQPFSIAGVSKKNSLGRAHGFEDKTQGTLFFNIAKILKTKRPKMFLLENVKNLKSHDGGRTFQIIKETLEELNYVIFYKIIDARDWVPQHRERIFITGFDRNVFGDNPDFKFPVPPELNPCLGDILEDNIDTKYTLTPRLWKYLQDYAEKHRLKGNGFGFGLFGEKDVSRTLSARYYKDGSEILIKNNGSIPRRLTPRECCKLMGFPEDFKITVSDMQAYKQFGNSVVVKVASAVAKEMVRTWHTVFKKY